MVYRTVLWLYVRGRGVLCVDLVDEAIMFPSLPDRLPIVVYALYGFLYRAVYPRLNEATVFLRLPI